MKKILFVIYSMGYGGAERSLLNLLWELPENNYEVDLLLFKKKGDFLKRIPGWVRVLEQPEPLLRLYSSVRHAGPFLGVKVAGTVCARAMRRTPKARGAFRWNYFYKKKLGMLPGHYDVAVAYVGSEVMYYVSDCVNADKKLVWIHNDYRTAGYSREDDGPYFADMDGIVSVSEECVTTLCEEFPECKDKVYCLENITSSGAVWDQANTEKPEEYGDHENIILSIGRLSPQKGFDMAIDAALILKGSGVSFRWYIIGAGDLKEKLTEQIEKNHLQDCVILLGTRSNPYPYIKHCKILVQSSRYEGKSVVLDEAKILCTPIVATDYPTVSDQVLDGQEGIITSMTPAGIAAGIQKILNDTALRVRIQHYLRSHEYGNQHEIEKYMELLN